MKRTKDDPPSSQDEESQSLLSTSDTGALHEKVVAASMSPSSGNSRLANPMLLAKMILRRVVTIVTSDDDETASAGSGGYGVVMLIKDIFVGTVFGLLSISVLIFLDHRNIIHLQSAHHFRESAFDLLNDPETLSNLEDAAGLKFIPSSEYDAMRVEIDEGPSRLAELREKIAQSTQEAEAKRTEVSTLLPQFEKLASESNLGLDKWCGACKWGHTSCDDRLAYVTKTYQRTEVLAKIGIMQKSPSCKNE